MAGSRLAAAMSDPPRLAVVMGSAVEGPEGVGLVAELFERAASAATGNIDEEERED